MRETVAIIGLGYVGLPLALACAKSGFKTVGIDIDKSKIEMLFRGKSYVEDVSSSDLAETIKLETFKPSVDYSIVKQAEIIVICVPTPLTEKKLPDLSHLKSAIEKVSINLRSGCLLIVESTVAPGTSRSLIIPLIEKFSKKNINNYFYAFSPERIDPKNNKWNLKNTPKLVAGLSKPSLKKAISFYSNFIDTIVDCSSLEVAETSKLLENSFRLVNISFINEFSIFCQENGLNTEEILKAASTKPYGFMPFFPSIGAGGHCIPVDPVYLSEFARLQGTPIESIDLAIQINNRMPKYYVKKCQKILGNLNGKRILIVGLSYKSDVSDVRESQVISLITSLRKLNASVDWHDEEVRFWNGETSVEISQNYDLAIIATLHKKVNLKKLGDIQTIRIR